MGRVVLSSFDLGTRTAKEPQSVTLMLEDQHLAQFLTGVNIFGRSYSVVGY